MMNKIYLIFALLLILPIAAADNVLYELPQPIKEGTCGQLTQHCANCSYVKITTIQYPGSNTLSTVNAFMTDNGLGDYNYTFCATEDVGDYYYSTLGDPESIPVKQSVLFKVTPSGLANVLGYFIIGFAIVYGIAFVGFFGKNEWVAIMGGLAMISLGVYTLINGIDVYRTVLTAVISLWTIGLGAFFAIYSSVSLIEENM